MTDLHGNEPIVFDFGSAGSLVTAARTAASAIRGQRGSRTSWVTQAEQDFSGFFAQLFRENALTAASDAGQLAVALDGLATITSSLVDQAHAENERRKTAREWYEARENRDTLDKIGDFFTGEDAPPSGPQPPPPVEPADVPPNRERRTSGRGPNGGTSSARPANLRTFAQSSSAADDELSPHQVRVTSLANTFNANTEWGQIDARGLVHAFQLWLAANENDARWARTLAAAFEEAGGSGAVSTLSNAGLAAALQAADVDATRDDLDITMPEALGFQPTTGYSLDPVNTATGNFIEDELDLAFAGLAQLELTRMYNSVTTEEGAFGHGWCSLADAGLAFDDEQATFTRSDGRVLVFPRLGDGWDRAQGANLWLSRVDEGYRISDNQGTWWAMDALGRPTRQGSGPGTTVTLTRDGDRLVEIADERGRCIRLRWEDRHGGRVVAAETSDGRTATYDYDTHGHLVAVTTAAGTRSYGWDVEQHLVVTVTDADGVVEVDNVYDAQRRVRTQLTQHGRRVRFSYLPGRVTVVDDEDGTRSNTWIADRSGRLVGVVDAHDERQSTAYDTHGNVIMVVERDGSTTVHEYDGRGRRTRTVSPSGTELTFHHDEADRLVAVITGDGALTEASYVGDDRDPSRIVDAEGGVAELTWERGLLTRVVGPTGVTVLREHDAAGNLVSLTDGEGHTSRFEHDAAGRLVAATTPLGHRTTYAYDAAGRLVSRTAPDGATWTYEHTPGGRLSVVVDPTGGRTTVEHGHHGERSLTTDPLGRTTRHDHDVLGNPAAVVLPDGTRWEYTHDALSRLTHGHLPRRRAVDDRLRRGRQPDQRRRPRRRHVHRLLRPRPRPVPAQPGRRRHRAAGRRAGAAGRRHHARRCRDRLLLRPLRAGRGVGRRRGRADPLHLRRRRQPAHAGGPLRLHRWPSSTTGAVAWWPPPTRPAVVRPTPTTPTAGWSASPTRTARARTRRTTSAGASWRPPPPAPEPAAGPTTRPAARSPSTTRPTAPGASCATRPGSSSRWSTATAASPATPTTSSAAP